jgi:hypothetical protein
VPANGPDPDFEGARAPDEADVERVKAALRRLAGPDHRTVVERADAAVEDLDAAAEFVETFGVAELERAVAAVTDPALRERGERALAAFRRFRAAAAGERDANHFHPGRDTDLRRGDEGKS